VAGESFIEVREVPGAVVLVVDGSFKLSLSAKDASGLAGRMYGIAVRVALQEALAKAEANRQRGEA